MSQYTQARQDAFEITRRLLESTKSSPLYDTPEACLAAAKKEAREDNYADFDIYKANDGRWFFVLIGSRFNWVLSAEGAMVKGFTFSASGNRYVSCD